MVPKAFERSLRALAHRRPFRPFTVELVSGDRIAVDHPEALVFRGRVAVYVSSKGVPSIFDHEGVSQLIGDSERTAS
jgi:hypothetical protein